MAGTLTLVDAEGREIVAAVDDQPLRVRLELDPTLDPPHSITVKVKSGGTEREIVAERIDSGAERPLYQTELTTVDETFSQFLDFLDPVTGHAPPVVGNGDIVRFEYEGVSDRVQVFDTALDGRRWFTELRLADEIGETTNAGIRYQGALRAAESLPPSPERDRLIEAIKSRLEAVHRRLVVLQQARRALDNPKLWAEQQISIANHYMNFDDIRDVMNVRSVSEAAKERVAGHIVSGFKDLTIGGYQMLVQSTGVAQLRTLATGENELGQAVGWEGRTLAFLDLVADGMLQGASLKFELDNLVAPSRPLGPGTPSETRYFGPNPETSAPVGAIVDPTQMGMRPEAIRAAHRAARATDGHLLIRPTTAGAPEHRYAGAHPKIEALKSKTINEVDCLLGADPDSTSLVGLFEPKVDFFEQGLREAGLSQAEIDGQLHALQEGTVIAPPKGYQSPELWANAAKRFVQRTDEFNGSTGVSTRTLVEEGVIRIEDGVIVNAETGRPFTGDHDPFDYVDSTGASLPQETYDRIQAMLEGSEFEAQHGAHFRWNPQREDFPEGEFGQAKYETAKGIFDAIIAKHQGKEILIVFSPVGPPRAIFAGGAPGPYLGAYPTKFTPAAAGSELLLPMELSVLGLSGTLATGITWDSSVGEWVRAESALRASVAEAFDDEAFDELMEAAEARTSALDADSEDDYDPFEGVDEHGGDTSGRDEAFDELMEAAEARTSALDAESEDDYDPFEGLESEATGGSVAASDTQWWAKRPVQGLALGIAAAVLFGVCSLGGGDEPLDTAVSDPVVPVSDTTGDSPESTAGPTESSEGPGFLATSELPAATTATLTWQPTRCAQLPEDSTVELGPEPGGLGASIPIALGLRGQLGDDTVVLTGGGGGTITRDGVTTKTGTVGELVSLDGDGFTATIERLEGPADDDGEFADVESADCSEGGTLTVKLDPSHWSTWVSLPRLDESILDLGPEPECMAAIVGDSIDIVFGTAFGGMVDPTLVSGVAEVRYREWSTIPLELVDATTNGVQTLQFSSAGEVIAPDSSTAGSSDGGWIWGGLRLTPPEAPTTDEPVDLALRFDYGIFRGFTWSVICEWGG